MLRTMKIGSLDGSRTWMLETVPKYTIIAFSISREIHVSSVDLEPACVTHRGDPLDFVLRETEPIRGWSKEHRVFTQ